MTHCLKIQSRYFEEIQNGDKTFEVRKNDRNFKLGDKVILQEYDIDNNTYSGSEIEMRISYILHGDFKLFGLANDHCVLGLREVVS